MTRNHVNKWGSNPRSTQFFARSVLLTALFVSVVAFGIALAQTNTDAPWAAFTSGGGNATSQNFEVTGVIGQPIVGHSSSENFKVDAGLLGGFAFNILCAYDVNPTNGAIDRPEAVQAVADYLLGLIDITRANAVDVVAAYLLGSTFDC